MRNHHKISISFLTSLIHENTMMKTRLSHILSLWKTRTNLKSVQNRWHSHSLSHSILHMRNLRLRQSKFLNITQLDKQKTREPDWREERICQQKLMKHFAFRSAEPLPLYFLFFPRP